MDCYPYPKEKRVKTVVGDESTFRAAREAREQHLRNIELYWNDFFILHGFLVAKMLLEGVRAERNVAR